MKSKAYLLLWCAAVAILAFICFDIWSARNSPLYKRLEAQWNDDVRTLENSQKLPRAWFDLRDIHIIGGTPETKDWLKRIEIPDFKTSKEGHYSMDALVVVWEEDGKRGATIQYDIEDLKSKNNIYEVGRTLILSRPVAKNTFKSLLEEFRL